MYNDDATRLQHMRDAARDALRFAAGRSRTDLDSDQMLALALTRELEIIGEAATRISATYRNQHSEIPWTSIIGMRNWLIHAYFTINLNVVWSTVVEDLPPLLVELEKIVSKSD